MIETGCRFYPCHKESFDSCTYCFCPLYPCLGHIPGAKGKWTMTRRGKVWDCSDCVLPHTNEGMNTITKVKLQPK